MSTWLAFDNGSRNVIPDSVKLVAGRTGQEYNVRKNRKSPESGALSCCADLPEDWAFRLRFSSYAGLIYAVYLQIALLTGEAFAKTVAFG